MRVALAPWMWRLRVVAAAGVLTLVGWLAAPMAYADEPAAADEEPEDPWKRSIEISFNGSTGNTIASSEFANVLALREDDDQKLDIAARYLRSSATDAADVTTVTARRIALTARNDWKLTNKRWSLFLQWGFEDDRFQPFDYRTTTGLGVGFKAIAANNGDDIPEAERTYTSLSFSLGVGTRHDFGVVGSEAKTELIVGVAFSTNPTDSQKVSFALEYLPEVGESEFRAKFTGDWKWLMSEEYGISFKLGIQNQFDSLNTPGVRHADFTYSSLLVIAL